MPTIKIPIQESKNYKLEIYNEQLILRLSTSEELFKKTIVEVDPGSGILVVEKPISVNDSHKHRRSNSFFDINFGLTSLIEVSFGSFLPVEATSNWVPLKVVQVTNLSW